MHEMTTRIILAFAVAEAWIIILNYEKVRDYNILSRLQTRIQDSMRIRAEDALHWAKSVLPAQFSFSENALENTEIILSDFKKYWVSKFLNNRLDNWNKFLVEVGYIHFFPVIFRIFLGIKCSIGHIYYEKFDGLTTDFTHTEIDERYRLFYDVNGGQTSPTDMCLDLHKLYLSYCILTQDVDPKPRAKAYFLGEIERLSNEIEKWESAPQR